MAHADVARDGQRIKLTTAFMEKDLVKQVPGTRFDYAGSCWYAPLSWGVAWALRGVFGENLEIGEALAQWSEQEWSERVEPSLALREGYELPAEHPISRRLDELGL